MAGKEMNVFAAEKPKDEQVAGGTTPTGWKNFTLDDLSDPRAPIRYGVVQIGPFTPSGVPIVPIKYINQIDRAQLHLASREIERRYANSRIRGGDVLLSVKGTIGEVGVVPQGFAGNIAREIARIRPNDRVQSKFLANLLRAPDTQRRIDALVVGTTRREFSIAAARALEVAVPPPDEQRCIVDILSTWDEAIETVEALIGNAIARKSALMQQLLTGTRRLPGFSDEWQTITLAEVADVIVSNVDKKSNRSERPVRLCNYMEVYNYDRIEADLPFMGATASEGQIKRFRLQVGDVLITKDSETPDDIAVASYVASTSSDLVCGYHLAIIRPRRADGQFLKFILEHRNTHQHFVSRANGATRFGLTVGAIEDAPIRCPGIKEQERIGAIIGAAEIAVQISRSKLTALRQEKAALIQQLMSGKRRVTIDGKRN